MIVGLGHVKRVGKGSAAEGLKRDLQFREVGFADKLKELALVSNPIIFANAVTNVGVGSGRLAKLVSSVGGWDQAKDTFPEIRGFLQRLGDGGRQVFGETFWTQYVFQDVKDDDRVVISDVRYLSEFNQILAMHGYLIRIDRPGHVGSGHVSETELAELPDSAWDAVISNDSTVMALQDKIVSAVKGFLRKEDGEARMVGEPF